MTADLTLLFETSLHCTITQRKKEMKINISQYILSNKIYTVRNMLAYSDYPISAIALTLAFSSQSYFTEIFRKQTEMTPMHYRACYSRSTETEKIHRYSKEMRH